MAVQWQRSHDVNRRLAIERSNKEKVNRSLYTDLLRYLDVGRVHHLHGVNGHDYVEPYNTEGSTESARGERDGELGTDGTRVTVDSGNLASDGTGLAAALVSLLGTVDVADALAKVPLGLLLVGDVLQLDDGAAGLLGTLTALVSHMASLDVETTAKNAY